MQSLDELRRVIRRVEARRPPRPAAPPAHEVLGGEVVETGAGPLVVVRREYPLTHVHGREPLAPAFTAPLELLSTVARAAAPAGDSRRLLFLDTETTGLAGGTGTYAFLVGVGRLDGDRFVVVQYFMRDFDEEPALLAALVPLLEQAAGVVTFNGSVFDHNRHDVLSLVALLGWFGRALAAPDHLGAEDLAGLGRLWEPVDLEQALTCYRAALGGDLPGRTAHRVRLRLARWEKRATRWDRACALWEVASRHGAFDREPWEELAKFDEHRRRDLRTARATVAHALELADAAGAPLRVIDAFAHRLSRLERRLRRAL